MEGINNNEQEIRIEISSIDQENTQKLYEATKKGCIQSLKKLMEDDPFLIQKVVTYNDSRNNNNENDLLLHLSISNGHLEFTRLLHYHPQLSGEVDSFQRTPLHLASKLGHIEIVEALLDKNMSACFVYDNNGYLPLHYAILSGQMDIMQELIKARPQSLWMKLKNGQSVLYLCVQGNNLEGMKLLVETYVNHDEHFLNTIDDKGDTILDLSIKLRQTEMVGYLFSVGEVKTRTSLESCEGCCGTKDILEFQKVSKTRNPRRLRSRKPASKKANERWKAWRNNLKDKGVWFQEVQGTMMLVATVIATVTFQAGLNPPGGVWQQDTQFNSSTYFDNSYYYSSDLGLKNITFLRPAGTAVMNSGQSDMYQPFLWLNSISFLASISGFC